MGRLAGKRALITAAGAGIGRATAAAFVAEGAQVLATDLNPQPLEGARIAALDVRDAAAITALVAAEGPFDILVNAAGWVAHGTILDCTEDDWTRTLDLNLTAMMRVTRAVLPGMLAEGGGAIVCIASAVGSHVAAPNRFAYGTSKAAVVGLAKSVAADFVGRGIRCNAICPGTIDTPSLAGRIEALGRTLPGGADEARRMFVGRQPVGRLGTAQEVAALAVYLASDEAAFVTGAAMVIDGGWTNI